MGSSLGDTIATNSEWTVCGKGAYLCHYCSEFEINQNSTTASHGHYLCEERNLNSRLGDMGDTNSRQTVCEKGA